MTYFTASSFTLSLAASSTMSRSARRTIVRGPTVLYDGPARGIARLFPRNINTMITCALATVGLDKCRAVPLRAPVIIAVGVDKSMEAKVLEIENICAAAAATQNLLLAAHALGLGAKWRTGEWARDPMVKEFLGLAADQNMIGFIYVGYPEFQPEFVPRPSFEDRTVWIE